MRPYQLFYVWAALTMQHLFAQSSSDIRLNQIGFYPSMPKIAVVRNAATSPFYILSTASSDTVFRGTLTPAKIWSYSHESVSLADFSELQTTGNFTVAVPGVGSSYSFDIKQHVHEKLAIGTVKGYYYQRASMPLLSAYAGTWARAAGHPDTSVLIHPSAATAQRPAKSTISAPRGWYDAGDYNEYIVNSGISTYTILAAYEHFPEFSNQLTTNIPESGNGIPDILDEALWNVRWMLSMQDPNDGGVYSKLTNANFDGFIMPSQATTPRYVVMKSTCATLDFAAVMAQAARITAKFSTALPGLSDSCLQASLKAWSWARQNPTVYYNQSQMNAQYPADSIRTGEYGDNNASDEFAWAAAELFVTTAQDSFLTVANPLSALSVSIPSWPNVRTLGLYTFAQYRTTIGGPVDTAAVRSQLINLANALRAPMNASAYKVVMGYQSYDFVWGSNGTAANQGMELLIAYKLTGDSTYLRAAISNLDYLLGRNGTTYCFVTGFGSHSPLHIHHRVSEADGIAAPVPGLIAGGPNPGMQDGVRYPSSLPALAYADTVASYASNEICINWNAPLVYLAVGLEALLSPNGLPTSLGQGHSDQSTPKSFGLLQNYPNPFNPETTISYQIPFDSRVRVVVYDVLGREKQTLFEGQQRAGNYEVRFDASGIASGVYFYRLSAESIGKESYTNAKKMVVLK